jgi:hypothetical protein
MLTNMIIMTVLVISVQSSDNFLLLPVYILKERQEDETMHCL